MSADPPTTGSSRRRLARALSRIADASVAEALALAETQTEGQARRIGVTGPPGAGKSSLIARLGRARLDRMSAAEPGAPGERLAILAIDPSSPVGGGAILGDRVRMDALTSDPRVYVRSLASRGGHDGLTHNIVDLLAFADAYGFEEVILETVGVGQAEHAARALVDTLVLVLHPDAGDSIQAMKSGIMEVADIYVVNKADLAGAGRTSAELKAVLKAAHRRDGGWFPPVIEIAQDRPDGIAALDAALEAHRAHVESRCDPALTRRERRRYHLRSLLQRRVDEIVAERAELLDRPGAAARYAGAIAALGEAAGAGEGFEERGSRTARA